MSEQENKEMLPSQVIFENLKELIRAKNTAHESMFKFHWKKMWPFSLFWPQVDFERIVRLMSEIRKNAINQKNLVLQAQGKAKDFEKTFLNAVPAYLDALDISCQKLSAAAQWKQDMLMKKITKQIHIYAFTHLAKHPPYSLVHQVMRMMEMNLCISQAP